MVKQIKATEKTDIALISLFMAGYNSCRGKSVDEIFLCIHRYLITIIKNIIIIVAILHASCNGKVKLCSIL